MFHAAFQRLSDPSTGFSGTRAHRVVADIIRHHRIQASPGFRAAAEHCAGLLRDAGLETEILRYPADFRTRYWANDQFPEWDCRSATLRLLAPAGEARTLADYDEHKLSLVQRSVGTPPGGVAAEIALLEDGEGETGEAGTGEEVLIVAHLCHPQPSANDNASGAATALECARTLRRLIDDGALPRPRRGIRVLLPPEITGSYCYLATNEVRIPRTIAAINLDMVGEDQALCHGPLLAERPPAAGAGFAGDLLAAIMRELARQDATNLAGNARYALLKWAVTPFSGGSDHSLFADPTVGIPCPMIIQWPDKFYHTSADTLDKVDPAMLRRAGILAATYAYAIAAAGEREALWLLNELSVEFRRALPRSLADRPAGAAATPGRWIDRQARFLLDRHRAALAAVRRLDDGPRVNRLIATLADDAERVARDERDRARSAATWATSLGSPDGAERAPVEDSAWERRAAALGARRPA